MYFKKQTNIIETVGYNVIRPTLFSLSNWEKYNKKIKH